MRDLTDYMIPVLTHYKRLALSFDAVYSGFLASTEQIDHCLAVFDAYPNALKVVDPVMGDNGKPYRSCTASLRSRMSELVAVADIITPNLTEATMLLGDTYPLTPLNTTQARSMLVRLSECGPGIVVVTSVPMADGALVNIAYDKEHGMFWRVDCERIPVHYPGTGDIFSSVLVGGMLRENSLPIAMSRATQFIEIAIKTTHSYGADPREGVMFESCMDWLTSNTTMSSYTNL